MSKYVLSEFTNYAPEVNREVRFWLCLALCREQHADDFYQEVKSFDWADYYFLRVFYLRMEGKSDKAQGFYERALDISPNMQKTKREYVALLLEQRKYDEALDKAKENFDSSPENIYHIHAYFRCLIKKIGLTNEEIRTLNYLIDLVDKSHSPKKQELVTAMKLKHDIIIAHKPIEQLLQDISQAETQFHKSPNIGRVISEFKFKQGISQSRQLGRIVE